jgi:hypothetical protein
MIFMNVPLFSRYKSCAKKTGTRDAHAMRLRQSYSGELRDQSRHAACASGRSAFGAEADMISDRSSRKRFSYFRFGRLRFGDDVASRRFAHLVSDGLPFT